MTTRETHHRFHALVLLLTFLSTLCSVESSVPLLYCENERADKFECQDQLSSARVSLMPWFAKYERRMLLDCGRFCVDEKVSQLTFQMPCRCDNMDDSNARRVPLELPGPLEGPIQMFQAFVETLAEGRCKENLAEMNCFVTFVSNYETSHHSSGGGFQFLDEDTATSAGSPIAPAPPTNSPVHATPNYNISFDNPDDIEPMVPRDHPSQPVAGGNL